MMNARDEAGHGGRERDADRGTDLAGAAAVAGLTERVGARS